MATHDMVLKGEITETVRDSAEQLLVYLRSFSGWLPSSVVKQYVHCRPSPCTFVVKRFENSRSIFPPIRPARPIAALVKTKFGPRFAWG